MDKEEKKKYTHIGVTVFLTAAAIIVFYRVIMNYAGFKAGIKYIFSIITPVIDGFVIAYLLSPVVNFIEERFLYAKFYDHIFKGREGVAKGKIKRRIRMLVIIFTYTVFLLLLYGFFSLVIPSIAESVQNIVSNFPKYMENFQYEMNVILEKHPSLEKGYNEVMANYSEPINQWINENILGKVNTALVGLLSGSFSILKGLFNLIIGLIISVYLVSGKELMIGQAKKVTYALMNRDLANAFIHNVRYTNNTFQGFFGGKIVDSIIIGFLCFIVTSIIGTPYAMLVSVIVGVTNIIPFFGPFIGAIPSAFLVLLVDPKQCLYFIILIIVLQQFDGNILGPMILGQSTGLPGFWVIFAITLFGGLFGFGGMLVGVPVFAVIYTGFKSFISAKLALKELPQDTRQYVHTAYVDDDGTFVKLPKNTRNSRSSQTVVSRSSLRELMNSEKKAEKENAGDEDTDEGTDEKTDKNTEVKGKQETKNSGRTKKKK